MLFNARAYKEEIGFFKPTSTSIMQCPFSTNTTQNVRVSSILNSEFLLLAFRIYVNGENLLWSSVVLHRCSNSIFFVCYTQSMLYFIFFWYNAKLTTLDYFFNFLTFKLSNSSEASALLRKITELARVMRLRFLYISPFNIFILPGNIFI